MPTQILRALGFTQERDFLSPQHQNNHNHQRHNGNNPRCQFHRRIANVRIYEAHRASVCCDDFVFRLARIASNRSATILRNVELIDLSPNARRMISACSIVSSVRYRDVRFFVIYLITLTVLYSNMYYLSIPVHKF